MRYALVVAVFFLAGQAFAECGCQAPVGEQCQEETLQTAAVASAAQSASQEMTMSLCADCEEDSDFLPLFEIALLVVVAIVPWRRKNRLLLLNLPREFAEGAATESLELPLAA